MFCNVQNLLRIAGIRWLATLVILIFAHAPPLWAASVNLAWDPSPSANVGGYRIYYKLDTESNYTTAKRVDAGNNPTGTVPNLQDGTYDFVIRAYDTTNTIESEPSNEVIASISSLSAQFTANPTSGTVPFLVTFTDTSTGTVTGRTWDFGDGTIVSGTSASQIYVKTYQQAGTYSVTLTDTGPGNSSDAVTKTNLILAQAPPPVANFAANPTSGVAPLTVNFTDASTNDITNWAWNFGDGGTSTSTNPSHGYSTAGNYPVTLTVSGPGGSDSETKTGYITVTSSGTGTTKAGLVAAYGFETPTNGQVEDSSGNGNSGIISNAVQTASGKFGNALSFNGTDALVTVNDSANLDLTNGMTLEAWVFPTTTMSGWHTVVLKEQPGNAVYYLYANTNNNQPVTAVNTTSSFSGLQRLYGGSRLPANTWTHLAATYDGSTQRLFINGDEVASRAQTGPIWQSGGALRIGGNHVWGEYFNGRLDEIRIYNRSLAASEIQSDMALPVVSEAVDVGLVEAGEIEIDDQWQHVVLTRSFTDPVVVANSASAYDSDPVTIRIRNLNPTGFDIRLQEWDYEDGLHAPETVGYLVMERGSHTLDDGTQVEAGTIVANYTDYPRTVAFGHAFEEAPVVISAVTSVQESDAVVTRMTNITTTGFKLLLQEQEANKKTHAAETISYVAWEPSSGTVDDVAFEVTRTGNQVTDTPYNINFSGDLPNGPVFLADMQTLNGGDTANVRWDQKDTWGATVWVDEEQSANSETLHGTEVVGYILLSPVN